MDKYEFSLKMEQMKKLIHEEDYLTALKIVEGIDWNRVRNTNLLTMAATVFEKNDRLEEAKEILHLALDRAPVGKRLLYKLTELAVRTGSLDEAEDYYYEFRAVDPEDIGNYVLQYMILKARHAPYDRQLQPLELFCQADPDEKWLYELATTYEFAGRIEDCIRTCDRIALLYGDSNYSVKALRLKMRYTDLTDAQKNVLYPRSAMTEQYQDNAAYGDQQESAFGRCYEQGNAYNNAESAGQSRERNLYAEYGMTEAPGRDDVPALKQEPAEEYTELSADDEAAIRNSNALAAARYENEDEEFNAYVQRLEAKAAELRAAEEAKRADEARAAEEAKRADMERAAAERSAELKAKAEAQQAAMQRAALVASVKNSEAAAPDTAEAVEASEESEDDESDDGQQMAFDFGAGDIKVVEETEVPAAEESEGAEVNASASVNVSDIAAASVGAAVEAVSETAAKETVQAADLSAGSTIAAVEAALNGTAPEIKKAVIPSEAAHAEEVRPAYKPQQVQERPQPENTQTINPEAASLQNASEERVTRQVAMKKFHMIVEAETVEDGLNIAVDELKAIHEENGIQHASAKTTASKLNEIGFTDSIISKIRGKDFVIENAGELDRDIIEDIYNFIRIDRSGTIVVMIDTPEGLDNIEDVRPELFEICDYISDIDDEEFEEKESKKAAAAAASSYDDEPDDEDYSDEPEEDDDIDDDDSDYDDMDDEPYDDEDDIDDEDDVYDEAEVNKKKEPQKRSAGKVKEKFSNVKEVAPVSDDEQMEIDDFAQYCSQYAAEIDCSITGKSMLALYERIELMEEEGIPLTKNNAEQLIEEAADRAEKPPIGKRISGMFHSKYDKNGCLILKEDDFIN